MSKGTPISKSELDRLVARAERLCDAVVQSTEFSPIPEVQREGARFVQIVGTWVAELEGRLAANDADFALHKESFEARLVMAERKVAGWWKPPIARVRPVSGPGRPRRISRVSAA